MYVADLLAAPNEPVVAAVSAKRTVTLPTAPPPVTNIGPDGDLVKVLRIIDDVQYYGACGNETVTVDGTTLYPLLPEQRDALDLAHYWTKALSPNPPLGFRRVVAPVPGDDRGTMIMYADGIARYQSASGRVIWLTTTEHAYNWAC